MDKQQQAKNIVGVIELLFPCLWSCSSCSPCTPREQFYETHFTDHLWHSAVETLLIEMSKLTNKSTRMVTTDQSQTKKEQNRPSLTCRHSAIGATGRGTITISMFARNTGGPAHKHKLTGSTWNRIATKIFEDFGEALCKEYIIRWEAVSIVHYTHG